MSDEYRKTAAGKDLEKRADTYTPPPAPQPKEPPPKKPSPKKK